MRRDRPSCSRKMFHACHGGCERPAGFTLVFHCVDWCSCQDKTRDVFLSESLSAPNILLWFAFGRIYERVIDPPQMEITPGSGVWLGQHSHKHGLFKVTHTHMHSFSLNTHFNILQWQNQLVITQIAIFSANAVLSYTYRKLWEDSD